MARIPRDGCASPQRKTAPNARPVRRKVTFVQAGLLTRGSMPSLRLPGNSQWHVGAGLTAYSCGGSSGFGPP
jgi:hypothetical protein